MAEEKPVELNTEPLFADGEIGITNFEINIDLDEDGELSQVLIIGTAAVTSDGGRFVHFTPLASGDTALGMLQRELAKQNKMFIVDDKKIEQLWQSAEQKVSEDDTSRNSIEED